MRRKRMKKKRMTGTKLTSPPPPKKIQKTAAAAAQTPYVSPTQNRAFKFMSHPTVATPAQSTRSELQYFSRQAE